MTQALDVRAVVESETESSTQLDASKKNDVTGFFSEDQYQIRSAEEKLELLWAEVIKDDTTQPLYWKHLASMWNQSKNGFYRPDSDEVPEKRLKTVHTQGLVAKVSWVPTGNNAHDYTGHYSADKVSPNCLIRFSQTTNLTEYSEGLLPSFALKFLITGRKSRNIFGMPSFKETDSWDFFENTMRNRVDHFKPADENGENDQLAIDTTEALLLEQAKWPYVTAVSQPGRYTRDGNELQEEEIRVPWELQFDSPFKGHEYTETDGFEWAERLQEIGTVGKTILNVWAVDEPGAEREHIADIVLDTDLVTSMFGDKRLFFQHDKQWQDFPYWKNFSTSIAIDPKNKDIPVHEWDVSAWPNTDDEAAKEMFMENQKEFGCPFAWLLNQPNDTYVKNIK